MAATSKISARDLRYAFQGCNSVSNAYFQLVRSFEKRAQFIAHSHPREKIRYPGWPDFKISRSHLTYLRSRYSIRKMPDMSGLHLSRLGQEVFNRGTGIQVPAQLDAPVSHDDDNVKYDASFLREVARAGTLLQDGARRLLLERGIVTAVCDKLRRYKEIGGAGVFDRTFRTVTIPQFHTRRVDPETYVPSIVPVQFTLHEYGHALDYLGLAIPYFSDMPAFRLAYAKGLVRYSGCRRSWMTERFGHYLPSQMGGRQSCLEDALSEAFAELYATETVADYEYLFPFRAIFREAADIVKVSIEALDYEMSLPLDPDAVVRKLRPVPRPPAFGASE